jgi:hypothetical protein
VRERGQDQPTDKSRARVKEHSYGTLIQLLREKAGFPLTSFRIEDLRSRFAPNNEGLRQRAAETKRVLRQIARNIPGAPNIIDGAVLTCKVAGRPAYFEADSLAAATGGKLHVVEVKSFPLIDGRCDQEKLGAACDQAAWYALLSRRELAEVQMPPDIVSAEDFIIVADGIGLRPTLVRQNLDARIRRAERLIASTPDPVQILSRLAEEVQFPAIEVDSNTRLAVLDDLLDTAHKATES